MAKTMKGISAAAEVLRKHPVEVQKALVQSCLQSDSALTIDEKARSCGLCPEELKAAYEASKCLVSALRFLKEAPATSLIEDLRLDADVNALLKTMASLNSPPPPQVGKQVGPLGKLVNVEWKMGVSAMSDLCKNLNSPFVMLELTVEDSGSNRSRHTIELTVPEFQKFASTMQELHAIMSTM
ncbi:uncharacterized protein LOC142578701 isoform X1 [Dermacentor variabilis]|uniref:uncharacterized protein LOC142578701 isoform X1 n=1 Tax=Dermacentor variabilis TaxID=34621 RepID=UPI003F5C12F0